MLSTPALGSPLTGEFEHSGGDVGGDDFPRASHPFGGGNGRLSDPRSEVEHLASRGYACQIQQPLTYRRKALLYYVPPFSPPLGGVGPIAALHLLIGPIVELGAAHSPSTPVGWVPFVLA